VADIFIAYAAPDQLDVERLTARLEREGWSVVTDRWEHLDRDFSKRAEARASLAEAVVVVWSDAGAAAGPLRRLANSTLVEGKLYQVEIADAGAGSVTRSLSGAYSGWIYDEDALCDAIAHRRPTSPAVPLEDAQTNVRPSQWLGWLIFVGLLGALVLAFVLFTLGIELRLNLGMLRPGALAPKE